MIALFWNLSTAIRGHFRHYMPTNRAIDWLRTPRGLKVALPVAALAALAYLLAMRWSSSHLADGGPGYFNVLVVLFFWNAMKFAWTAALSPVLSMKLRQRRDREGSSRSPRSGSVRNLPRSGKIGADARPRILFPADSVPSHTEPPDFGSSLGS